MKETKKKQLENNKKDFSNQTVKSIKNKDSIIFLFMIMLLFMGSVFYFTI